MSVYLDNSATTKPSQNAVNKALEMMTTKYGNPSSLHNVGLNAELEIESAREIIAKSLNVDSKDIYFTSGGTESNNMILSGVANKQKKNGKKIITTCIEHSSILDTTKKLKDDGFEIVYLSINKNGVISLDELEEKVDDNTILVSIMAVNNEIGSVQPIEKISQVIRKKNQNTLIHVDAIQAYGKIKLTPKKWNIDFMSISAHKIHAPKNCGAVYINNSSKLFPMLYGGEQQKKVRPGTECASLIPSFGVAVSEFNIDKNYSYINELNYYAVSQLENISDVIINSSKEALPYIINISVKGIKSETMLHFLESKEIYVSSGSACAKGKKSHVLTSLNLDSEIIDSALRISFSKYNKKEDIDLLTDAIKEGIERLSKKWKKSY